MGIFDKMTQKATETWLETVTMAELDKLESQGCDVSEWKAYVEEREARTGNLRKDWNELSDEDFEDKTSDQDKQKNPVNLNKLKPHIAVPRDTNGEFVRAVAKSLPLFGKAKKLEKVANGELVYAAVVQANSDLWEPGDGSYLPAVLVFALDKEHKNDEAWVKKMANKIAKMKHAKNVPDDCKKLINSLQDDQSDFCWKIGASVSEGADAWCSVYKFDKRGRMPNKCLPSNGVIPLIIKWGPEENLGTMFFEIPSVFYV